MVSLFTETFLKAYSTILFPKHDSFLMLGDSITEWLTTGFRRELFDVDPGLGIRLLVRGGELLPVLDHLADARGLHRLVDVHRESVGGSVLLLELVVVRARAP